MCIRSDKIRKVSSGFMNSKYFRNSSFVLVAQREFNYRDTGGLREIGGNPTRCYNAAHKMRLRKLPIILWFVLICNLSSSHTYAADKWLSVRSKNFLLVGNASEATIKRVGRELEEFRTALGN